MILLEDINKLGFFLDKNNIFNIDDNHLKEAQQIISNNDIKCHYLNDKPLENIKIIQNPQNFLYLNKTYQNINDHIDIKKKNKIRFNLGTKNYKTIHSF